MMLAPGASPGYEIMVAARANDVARPNVVAKCERSDGDCGRGMPRPYITHHAIDGPHPAFSTRGEGPGVRPRPYIRLHADRMALGSTLTSIPLPAV